MNLMNKIFQDYLDKFVIILVDDILVTQIVKSFTRNVRKVLEILRKNNYVNFSKYNFWMK